MSLRVGIDVRLAHWPGIGRYIDETVRCLVADFPGTEFMLFHNPAGPQTLRRYSGLQLSRSGHAPNLRFIACDAPPFSLRRPFELSALAHAHGVQVMHTPYINLPWQPPWPMAARRLPLVVTLHDFNHPDLQPQLASPRTWAKWAYAAAMTRHALSAAAHVVCVSRFLAEQVLQFRPALRERIEVIHHAASDDFRPLGPQAAAAQVARWFGTQGRYLLFVGTLKPHKNLLAVLRAMAEPGMPQDHALLVAAAPDDRYPEAAAEVARLGLTSRVRFLGHVALERLPALYGAAVATLLPSSYESFGLPVIESMACGTPVIAAPGTALREVGGAAALYTEPRPDALAAAMRRVLQPGDEHAALRAASLARAREFSWRRSAAALHALYERAALAPVAEPALKRSWR